MHRLSSLDAVTGSTPRADFDWHQHGGVLFDLDGVITPTAEIHEHAWGELFADFDYTEDDYLRYIDGKPRYDGVRSFLASRDVVLPEGDPTDAPGNGTVCAMGNRKNDLFNVILERDGIAAYPGSLATLELLDAAAIPSAIVSSSKNATRVLEAAGLGERFEVVVGSTQGETILSTNNVEGKPMAKLQVRQAIAHAINRDELIAAESGFALPIGTHFSPADPAYVDLTGTYPFDLAKAKELMKAAGYENGFEATLKLPPVGYAKRAGEVMVSQLGKIGIKLSIVQLEWPQWLSEVFKERNYDFTIVAHTEAYDIDRYARDGYYWNYVSEEFRNVYKEMVATVDPAKRAELLKQLQTIIAKDAVNGYLFQLAKIGVWNKNLVGMWENSPTPSIDLTQVYWK